MVFNFSFLWLSAFSLTIVLLIAKYAVQAGVHPLHFTFLQAFGSFIFIYFFNLLSGVSSNSSKDIRANITYFTTASFLGIALPQLLVFYAVIHVGVGVASLSYCLPLVVTYFISISINMERIDFIKILFLVMTVMGTFIYLFRMDYLKEIESGSTSMFWYLILLIVPFSLGIANIYRTINWPKSLPTTVIAQYTNLASTILLTIIILFFASDLSYVGQLNREVIVLLLIQMVFSGISQIFAFILQKKAGPVFISQTGSVVTVLGGILGYLVFSESYNINTLVGSILIFTGVYLFSLRKFSNEALT